MSIEQNHSGSGDIIRGGKTTNNNLFLDSKWLGFLSVLIIAIGAYFHFNPTDKTTTTIGDTTGSVITILGPGATSTTHIDKSETVIQELKPQPRIMTSYEGKLKAFKWLEKDNILRYLGDPIISNENIDYYEFLDFNFSIKNRSLDESVVKKRFDIFDQCNPSYNASNQDFPLLDSYLPEITGIRVQSRTEKDELLCFGSLPCLNLKNLIFLDLLNWLEQADATIFQFDFTYTQCTSDAPQPEGANASLYAYIKDTRGRYRVKIELLSFLDDSLVSKQINHFLEQDLSVYYSIDANDIFYSYDDCIDKLLNGADELRHPSEYWWDSKDSLIFNDLALAGGVFYTDNPLEKVDDFDIIKEQIYNQFDKISENKDGSNYSGSCKYIALFDKFNRSPLVKLDKVPIFPLEEGHCGECCDRVISCKLFENINNISFGNYFEDINCLLNIDVDFFAH